LPRFSITNSIYFKRALFSFILVISVFIGLLSFKMVDVAPVTASLQDFSAERAISHIEAISQRPHPMGTLENEQVRDYIIGELAKMGITAEVQGTMVPDYFGINPGDSVSIYNIIVVLKGTNPTGSIALVGHYDTVPASPGANDDGSAVATLLETTRGLINGPPLQNDVIILFTDAEEPGQFRYGARFFVSNYEYIEDIKLILNFEALGHTGPSIMFETGSNNDWLIEGLSRGAPNPVAFSFMSDLYRLIAKGGTDFIAFEEIGINGMDFSYSFGRTGYHTALDNIESLDERSLQHHGDYAINLTRYYGDLDLIQLTTKANGDVVYHSFFGGLLAYYPVSWAIPLVIVSGILLICLVVAGIKRGKLTTRCIALGTIVFSLEIIAITTILTLAWWGLDELHLAFGTVVEPTVKAHLLFVAFLVLSIAIMIMVRKLVNKRFSLLNLTVGVMAWWWLIAMLASLYLPGFCFILTWPLLFSFLPLSWVLFRNSNNKNSWVYTALISTSAIVIITILSAPIYLFFQAMGVASPGFSGSPSFPIISFSIIFWVMMLGLLVPHLQFFGDIGQRKFINTLLVIVIICLVIGSIVPGINIEEFGLMN